jgi:hypothetical protein
VLVHNDCEDLLDEAADVVRAGNGSTGAFINGWTKEKVLALPKGQRPSPQARICTRSS